MSSLSSHSHLVRMGFGFCVCVYVYVGKDQPIQVPEISTNKFPHYYWNSGLVWISLSWRRKRRAFTRGLIMDWKWHSRVNKLEGRSIEIIQYKQQRERRFTISSEIQGPVQSIKSLTFVSLESLEEGKEDVGTEKSMWRNNSWKPPRCCEKHKFTDSKRRANPSQYRLWENHARTQPYHNKTLLETKDKENILQLEKNEILHTREQ